MTKEDGKVHGVILSRFEQFTVVCVRGHHITFPGSAVSEDEVLPDAVPNHITPCTCKPENPEQVLVPKGILKEYAQEA